MIKLRRINSDNFHFQFTINILLINIIDKDYSHNELIL